MYIYIHIPFCSNICRYCDFPKLLYDKNFVDKYLDVLEKEISSRYKGEVVKSIYIGGGTPTSLDCLELEKLMNITKIFNRDEDFEFTVESNVDGLDKDKLVLMKDYGVNRISLGVQSLNNNTLIELNRKHTKEMVIDVVEVIKRVGISNISIDYIYGVNDNIEEIKEDMKTFLELDIPHISCYSLIIENNTVFGINKRKYIDEEIEYEMYSYISKFLSSNGYNHYEISNYGIVGYQSLHNLNYWNNGFYYGFGMGSVSYLDGVRISNTKNLSKYLLGEYVDSSIIEDKDMMISNTIILGLRKIDGIKISDFNKRFNLNILDLYNISELIAEGKLVLDKDNLFIADKYFYMANEILINFV